MERLRAILRLIAQVYRLAFWVMILTGVPSALMVFSAIRAAMHPGATVHWPHVLIYSIPIALIAALVRHVLGKISARYFRYVIKFSDIRFFGGGSFSDRQTHRYTRMYEKWKD
jgi:hypothetical protein